MAAAGDLDGAVAACRELVSRVPALTSVYLQIGRLLERKGDTAAAEAAYERLLKLEPGNESARAALEKVKGKR
jgi:Flp pilus assembly protein TadD